VVTINSCKSAPVAVTSGVPQGSHLGSLLFSIFINDISSYICNSKYLQFADDLKIYRPVVTVDDCVQLQGDIDGLQRFCDENRLVLNVDKCAHITFTRNKDRINFNYSLNGAVLKKVEEIRDLGVILDSKLSFEPHVEAITQKSIRNLGFITRTAKHFRKKETFITLFNTLVRSNLEFAVPVWNPCYDKYMSKIERVQRKCINVMNYKFNRERFYHSYKSNLLFYRMNSLSDRRLIFDLIFLHKLINNKIDSSFGLSKLQFYIPNRDFRNRTLFLQSLRTTNACINAALAHAVAALFL